MSTRSMIGIQNPDNTVTAVYCHSDGYLSHNGNILLKHYTDVSRVRELISWGDMSTLGPVIVPDPTKPHSFNGQRQAGVCVFYGRDRGEVRADPRTYASATELVLEGEDACAEYVYIYIATEGKWYLVQVQGEDGIEYTELTEFNTSDSDD